MRGVRRDAGGGAGALRVRLPRLRDPAGAPAGAHAPTPAAPAQGAAHPKPPTRRRHGASACSRTRARARACAGSREFAVRRLLRAAERAGGPRALRVPSLQCRAYRRRRASPGIPRLAAPRHSLSPGAAPSRHYFEAISTPASRGAYQVF